MRATANQLGRLTATQPAVDSPFSLTNAEGYRRWRERKLSAYPTTSAELLVEIDNPRALRRTELEGLRAACRKANMAIYASRVPLDKGALRALGAQLGLTRLDSNLCADADAISSLRVAQGGLRGEYIPYTNRPLNWHTDGYYNAPDRQIRAWALHCARTAAAGGANLLLDHEVAYILLRDSDPEYVHALMHPQALTIPPNRTNEGEIRPQRKGPVFTVDPTRGTLQMRYTIRKRHIEWHNDPTTVAAVSFLSELLQRGTPYILSHRLEPGQGIIANNVLHCRRGFQDDPGGGRTRLLYRARYYDRIAGTHLDEVQR